MVIGVAPVRGRRRAGPTSHRRALFAYPVVVVGVAMTAGVDRTLGWLVPVLSVLVLPFVVRSLAFAISTARWADRDLDAPTVGMESFTPSVAVVVVCQDDEVVVDSMVAGLLALDYPSEALTMVLVDDSSTDNTGAHLDAWAHADLRVRVLHRAADAGGGLSGALNDALTMVDADVAVAVDIDHRPTPGMLRRLVRHFRDPSVGAVLGRCVPGTAGEPARDQPAGRLVDGYGRQALFELTGHGGAGYAVRVDLIRALGGWNRQAITEDTDLMMRVQLAGRRVRYDPSAVEVDGWPSTADTRRQRYRSARGHQQALREQWLPLVRSRHLSVAQKAETLLLLATGHLPVWCGLALVLCCLRAGGIGAASSSAVVTLAVLVVAGAFVELAVGPLLGGGQRSAVRLLIGFPQAFGSSILTATAAYVDGMWGRTYRRPKRVRSGVAPMAAEVVVPQAPTPTADSLSFARREALALSMLNARIGQPLTTTTMPDQVPGTAEVLAP